MKIFRDPIHNVINLDTGDKHINELIIRLIDSEEFQRLHYIKQLGFTYFAYPAATHSRFEHSLGVAFLAKRFLEQLLASEEFILSRNNGRQEITEFFCNLKKNKHAAIIAALLHDIGHGPLSHTTEDLFGLNHEERGREIIKGGTRINKILSEFDKTLPDTVCQILSGEKAMPASKLISGQLDVDRMDYLLRDAYMTGSKYGVFDLEWLLNTVTVGVIETESGSSAEIGFDLGKGLSIAEDFVMARVYMFRNVYFHKISFVAQEMLKLLILRIRELPEAETSALFPCEALRKAALYGAVQPLTPQEFLSVSDIDFYYFFKQAQKSADTVISGLATGILTRRLYKEINPEEWGRVKEYITAREGEGMVKYYMFKLGLGGGRKKLSCQSGDDKLYLFNKMGKGFELLEKSAILPFTDKNDDFLMGRYVQPDIHDMYMSHKS